MAGRRRSRLHRSHTLHATPVFVQAPNDSVASSAFRLVWSAAGQHDPIYRYLGAEEATLPKGAGALPRAHSLRYPRLGAWASMMGNPYLMLAGSVSPERFGVYMGIFNMFIVIPMMIQIFTLPLYHEVWLGGNRGT
jgi:hypothetical protein